MWDGSYWEERKDLDYYRVVKNWLESLGEQASILDIGCGDCPVASWGAFAERTSLNLEPFPVISGVNCIVANWFDFKSSNYSVITCLQVLEHLDDKRVTRFVSKIFDHCDIAIISVPYKWKKGFCEHHLQDPIDMKKFIDMIGRDPIKTEITSSRIVGYFSKLLE